MRADRLLSIMLLLQAKGQMTTQALADSLAVSRRTILRDVEALSLAGVPVYAEAGHGGGVSLDENYRVSLTGLNEAEVRSLFVSTVQGPLQDVGLGEAADKTLLKLFAALPSLHQREAERIQQRIYLDAAWWWHEGQTLPFLEMLKVAIFEEKRTRIRYEHGSGEVVERVVEPYSLVAKASVWYVIAFRDSEFRTYRVSRFHDVMLLNEKFTRQADFDLATYWRKHVHDFVANVSSYAFTLRIRSEKRQFLKWYAPGRYTIVEEDEGEFFIAHLRLGSLEAARMLVLGLGTDAEVIDPLELRLEIGTFVRQLTALYLDGGDT
ncbi:MAG: YafY family protein [bacterium]|nr:YafY family protein [bacterium]